MYLHLLNIKHWSPAFWDVLQSSISLKIYNSRIVLPLKQQVLNSHYGVFLNTCMQKIAVVLDVQENGNPKPSIKNTCVLMNSDGTVDVMTKDSLKLAPMAPGSVVLEMVFGEVCGTDVHLQHGLLDMVPYPIIPGHVAVGKVYNVAGSVTDVEGSKVGKRASHIL